MSEEGSIQREVLAIPDRRYAGPVAYDANDPDSQFPPIEPLRPPEGAPNVLIVLIDDTVGYDSATPVSDDYGPKLGRLTGRVRSVQIDIDEAVEDLDHLIAPEERLRIAMARQ